MIRDKICVYVKNSGRIEDKKGNFHTSAHGFCQTRQGIERIAEKLLSMYNVREEDILLFKISPIDPSHPQILPLPSISYSTYKERIT